MLIVVAVWQAVKRAGRVADEWSNDGVGLVELRPPRSRREATQRVRKAREGAMVQGVIEDKVAISRHAPHQVGIGAGPGPGDTETSDHVVLGETIEDVLGIAAIGASVERQG